MTYNTEKRNNNDRRKLHYSPNLVGCLQNAIDNTKMATLEYESRDYEISVREIEPMALIFKNGKRNLVAFCHLRNEYRTFRLDRINLFKVNNAEFSRREGFNVADFEGDDEYTPTTEQGE